MNIAIDITPLTSGHSGRGVGVYTKHLIESLPTYANQHAYHFFTRDQPVPKNADIVHYPYFDPFFLTLPFIKGRPTVVTVHDLIPLVFPDKFPRGIRGSLTWQMQRLSLAGAKRIITDSEASKHDISRLTGIADGKIDRVYLAPDPFYTPGINERMLAHIRSIYSISGRYIVYVGDVNWNKNIEGLLRAFAHMQKQKKSGEMRLVLVGKAFVQDALLETQQINNLIHTFHLEHAIVRTGKVPDEDLAALYSAAVVCVQPSFYEGFGLPVLEAMACGCPVVTSDTSSLSEIAGPAIRIRPGRQESLVDGLMQCISMTSTARKLMIQEGFAWVAQFTWEKTARNTVKTYEKVLAAV